MGFYIVSIYSYLYYWEALENSLLHSVLLLVLGLYAACEMDKSNLQKAQKKKVEMLFDPHAEHRRFQFRQSGSCFTVSSGFASLSQLLQLLLVFICLIYYYYLYLISFSIQIYSHFEKEEACGNILR